MTRQELLNTMIVHAGDTVASIKPSKATLIAKAGRGNFVTLADKTSEQILFEQIRRYFPHDSVLSEETDNLMSEGELLQLEHLWIIDPIDGTANYQYQRQYSAVSVAYASSGMLVHAAVYDPFRKLHYRASKGQGAYLGSERLTVSTQVSLNHAAIITDNSYDPAIIREHLQTLLKLPTTPWVIMKGSLALEYCEIAAGQADLIFSYCPKPWDNAAGMLVLQEAGATIVDRNGTPTTFLSPSIVAGNKHLVDQMIQYTQPE